ncbi:MAG: MarR family transcriptional regulator [Hyphomonas sp.]|nr:MarR family transcriptional regulator [Hyphomonas sp.]
MNVEDGTEDLVTRLRQDWAAEDPSLNSSAMDVVGRVLQLAHRWQAATDDLMAGFGLSYTEFDIIATIRRQGEPYELTPTQLSRSVLLTSGAMTAALSRIEKKGLITRRRSDTDGRVSSARLTRKGARIALLAARARFELAMQQIAPLPHKDRRAIESLLVTLLAPAQAG